MVYNQTPIGPFLVASSKARYAADFTTPRLQTSAISRLQNSKIFLFLPSFDSAQDDKGGKISFTLSTQLLVLISHISHAGSYIINFTTLRLHNFTPLRLHTFTPSRLHNSTNSRFTISILVLLQINNSQVCTRELYRESNRRKKSMVKNL